MKICITCVYWTLLFISVVSSALLFIMVASESAQTNYYSSFKNNETSETYNNDTLDNVRENNIETSSEPITELKDSNKLDTNYEGHQEEFSEESIGYETVIDDKTRKQQDSYNDPDIVAASLTQQPNLSQGISENEQSTIVTLVDTTVAELQSLAEPKFNHEFSRTRLYAKNSSLLTKNTNIGQTEKEQQEILPSTQTSSPPQFINEITEKLNETNNFEEESILLADSVGEDVVVVVRAEQTVITSEGSEDKLEDDVVKILPDEIPTVDETFAATSELSDTKAKARLVGDNRDDAAATVVLGEGIVSVGSSNSQEDIPSFSEWTQKRLEEAEKKKTHPNVSVQNSGAPTRGIGGIKVRSKNYASPDCGAKIVAANPEAHSARSVLVSTRDEYMLNTCTSRIWFVVELCEAIQAKKIELANFELFSSSPKDFSVYISDRFPTRDWSPVGQFTAKDIKDIQNFALQPHLFGKFIKIELQTYYGSEHFCPISLFRAYGTSEFEVLETETENQILRETQTNLDDEEDGDEEEVLDVEDGEPPRNLFGSARDAVLSIMKKAAEVLVKSSDLTSNNITKIQQSMDDGNILENSFMTCTTPRYTILCDNCSDQKFAKIFQLVSCREQQLNELLEIDLVNRTLRQNGLCEIYGVGFETSAKRETERKGEKIKNVEKYDQVEEEFDSTKNFHLKFITSILNSEYIAALCNVLAIKERKMVMNTSHEIPFNNFKDTIKEDTLRKDKEDYSNDVIISFQHTTGTCSSNSDIGTSFKDLKKSTQELSSEEINRFTSTFDEISSSSETAASQIKLTKPFEKEEMKNDSSIPILESSKSGIEESFQPEISTTIPASLNIEQQPVLKASEEPFIPSSSNENTPQMTVDSTVDSTEIPSVDMVSDIESEELSGMLNKVEKVERLDQKGEQGQADLLDHEIKLPSQDSLAFDNLLSDLKDLEGEAAHIQNGPVASASVTQSTTNTTPQKESVFLRLSNRIKALERNMSLSGQYLEELSRRYKKQVEEMQKFLERTVSAMNEETRKRDEREAKSTEEIAILKEEIASLADSVKNFVYDRDSWRGRITMITQHLLLICSEVFIIYLILLYCRGNKNKKLDIKKKQQSEKNTVLRKSAESFGSNVKKTKKRRPSEIASHITGTYHELMIHDRSDETKKEKKKKRKKAFALGGNQTNVNNDIERNSIMQSKTVLNVAHEVETTPKIASSAEVLKVVDSRKQIYRRLKSAPEESAHDVFNDSGHETKCDVQLATSHADNLEMEPVKSSEFNISCVENANGSNTLSENLFPEKDACSVEPVAIESSTDASNFKNTSGILKDTSVPSSFMKTALSTRKARKAYSCDVNGEWSQNSTDSDDKTAQVSPNPSKLSPQNIHTDSDTTTNGLLMDQSDESRSSSVTSMSKKKEKKSSGFRKMVRKFF
ncbi:PREDICTED: SUN domain-containing ossification factor [Habropoda laboriosa]|uniref:SUN domain-containing ossification factor n=1 Tax=Habropoda laboriosa TaxID=597456 RepID=UPI00083E4B3A|nr:PREDICTED: SUN domain-containing ossification factor [Habropoda laboriosa]